MTVKLTWMIGGAQGSGVDTSASIFGNAVARAGYYIYGNREYHSNIKGRHSYFNLTISDVKMNSLSDEVNILATFDAETVFQHFTEVKDYIIYDKALEGTKISAVQSMEPERAEKIEKILTSSGYGTSIKDALNYAANRGVKVIPVDYSKIISEIAGELKLPVSVVDRARNLIASAVSLRLLGIKLDYLKAAIRVFFRNELYIKMNERASEKSYDLVQPAYNLSEIPVKGHRVQLDGNTAVAIGKIAGGLRVQTYYPITPAADESMFIEDNEVVDVIDPETKELRKAGVLVFQSEDELSAVNMAIGAALTGVRAATATSGPGFSLMAEGIGWAGMNEAPVVITYYMRGAPSTGMPTRGQQADLLFAVNVSHGEFPRIVIASGDHVEAFWDAIWSLNLAERYQTPVIHLVDKFLANSYSIIDEEELDYRSKKIIDRGKLMFKEVNDYKRFEFTDDGISPRVPLGYAVMHYSGDEHNEYGIITEESENRIRMYEKRLRKLETADREIPEEQRLKVYGDESDIAVVTWGSPKGPAVDALQELKSEGINIQVIQVRMFNPYPRNLIRKLLEGKKMIINLEANYTAQAAQLMKLNAGIEPTHYVLKWNGRPITRTEVKWAIKHILSTNEKKVVLSGGA
ncbi:2-oxoacid:ferredoxin oxidoreductase subunit alpha [Caldivirga sp. UBA161]|uniref:2-oxoacid:ferredoxin oxidoreductase subunit alpha n=1 Tax=Caldivirga sp. UBA161 TaxID=1915569 RepID=UPI0025C47260|nr:2-oxoacid:ferredoxin oxidoreductase subunit alpha [Caldivirga sp. UBA161]